MFASERLRKQPPLDVAGPLCENEKNKGPRAPARFARRRRRAAPAVDAAAADEGQVGRRPLVPQGAGHARGGARVERVVGDGLARLAGAHRDEDGLVGRDGGAQRRVVVALAGGGRDDHDVVDELAQAGDFPRAGGGGRDAGDAQRLEAGRHVLADEAAPDDQDGVERDGRGGGGGGSRGQAGEQEEEGFGEQLEGGPPGLLQARGVFVHVRSGLDLSDCGRRG